MATNYKINKIPLIITRGVVVFPAHNTIIEVGRLKTVNACNEAFENFDGQVLVISQKDPNIEEPGVKDVYKFGTLCRARLIKKWEEGAMRITVTGIHRVQIKQIQDDENMFTADVVVKENENVDSAEENAFVRQIAKSIEEMATRHPIIPQEIINELSQGVSASELADTVAHYLPMPLAKKQAILEQINVNNRLKLVLKEIEEEKNINKIEDTISKKIRNKIDDSQREYYLREKLRAIKEELGEISPKGDDIDEIRKRVEKEPFPKAVKERIREELKRFELTPPASSEASIIRTYIDWLISIPWYKKTEDVVNLVKARKVLDRDHYGLKKIKERIIEYLAVLKKTNKLAGQIICLVGPPGVGKTSLAKGIAEAIGRKFVKISLGGVRDESEIRGHRRTYIASMPGRIIQGMKKVKTLNPVFLIDEIDKMSSDFRGDPASAMLEVLDPEQNEQFSDHYIEEPYDLSNVMFLATANSLDDVPNPLLDRMEIIQLSSYTEHEKLQIAVKHLVGKVLEKHGLTKEELTISKDAIMEIIQHYTREAGVRQLERSIAKVSRKVVLEILQHKKEVDKITKKNIEKYLGKWIFNHTKKNKDDCVGIVTGLAYTSFGGDILPIEVTYYRSKEGKLSLTGQLGDVMQESASIALSYIKANYKKFNVDYEVFEENTIHIHAPEGAIPKDGPSAGVTLTTAIISAINKKPVSADIGMTGEISLRGNVLPIGGLREKLISAARSKLKKIFIPKENTKDLEELPKEVLDSLEIIPVSSYGEIYKAIFK